MRTIWTLRHALFALAAVSGAGLLAFAQPPADAPAEPPAATAQPPATPAEPAAQITEVAPGAEPPPAAADAAAAAPDEPVIPLEPETAGDTFLQEMADRLDRVEFLSADFEQAVQLDTRQVVTDGRIRHAPGDRSLMEVTLEHSDVAGRRLDVSDGQTAYRVEEVAGNLVAMRYDVAQILAEARTKPEGVLREVRRLLPLMSLGDRLRGYVADFTFGEPADATFTFGEPADATFGDGGRAVKVVEGQWRKRAIAALLDSKDPAVSVEQLPGQTPQFIRVTIDQQTGYPLKTELFRRTAKAEYKPLVTLTVTDFATPEDLPDATFAYTPPADADVRDQTAEFVNRLKAIQVSEEQPVADEPPPEQPTAEQPAEP